MFDAGRGVVPITHVLWYEITAYCGLLRCLGVKVIACKSVH